MITIQSPTGATTDAFTPDEATQPLDLKIQLGNLLNAEDGFQPPIFADVGITPEWMRDFCSQPGGRLAQSHRVMAKVAMEIKGLDHEIVYLPNLKQDTNYPMASLLELTQGDQFFNLGIALVTSANGDPYNLAVYINSAGELSFLRIAPTCLISTGSFTSRDALEHMMEGVDRSKISLKEGRILLPKGVEMAEILPEKDILSGLTWNRAHLMAIENGDERDLLYLFDIAYKEGIREDCGRRGKKGFFVFYAPRYAVNPSFYHYGKSFLFDLAKKFDQPDEDLKLTRAQAIEHANRVLWLLNEYDDESSYNNPVVVWTSDIDQWAPYRGRGVFVRPLGIHQSPPHRI